jgi:hypothetical protein
VTVPKIPRHSVETGKVSRREKGDGALIDVASEFLNFVFH